MSNSNTVTKNDLKNILENITLKYTELLENILLTETKTQTVGQSIAANASGYVDMNIEKVGYTPIGIVAFSGSGTGGLNWADWYFPNSTTARLYYSNNTATTYTLNSVSVRILYRKNRATVSKEIDPMVDISNYQVVDSEDKALYDAIESLGWQSNVIE